MKDCIFCKIASGLIAKEFVYQDKDIMVFWNIKPLKPVHLLLVPRKHFKEFIVFEDSSINIKLIKVAKAMIKKYNLDKKGYRLVINGGGAQHINHFHIHLLGPIEKD